MSLRRRAFSLIELVIVLVILAVVAGMAIPRYGAFTESARASAIMNDINEFRRAVLTYYGTSGEWPVDVVPGVHPPELEGFIEPYFFTKTTPIGGIYDWNEGWGPFNRNISVRDAEPPLEVWLAIDTIVDDGNLSTGDVRKHNAHHLCFKVD